MGCQVVERLLKRYERFVIMSPVVAKKHRDGVMVPLDIPVVLMALLQTIHGNEFPRRPLHSVIPVLKWGELPHYFNSTLRSMDNSDNPLHQDGPLPEGEE